MPHPIVMPKPGQMTEECTLLKWRKKEGEKVAKGEVLFEIETDKSAMEVESFFDGTLLKVLVSEGQTVPVAAVCGFVGRPGEALPKVEPPAAKPAAPAAPAAAKPSAPTARTSAPMALQAPAAAAAPTVFRISPRAARLAEECAIDPASISGSGPLGRIVEKDVRAHLEARGYAKLRVTSAALELARREKVDLLSIAASGDGRISVADVERAVEEKPRPMSKMRQVIAQRLTHSFTTTPHFFVTAVVDMTELLAFRAELKQKNAPYTMTDFILQAVTSTLREFPAANSASDGVNVWRHGQVNLGVAVSLEHGLVVPVIRNAGEMTLLELHEQAAALIEKARAGKLPPDEMTGGTFTVSNMGMLDVENFTAIINPGESAILAVASTKPTPVVRNGQIVARQIMKITLSADHRLLDGATAARFVNAVKEKLENQPLWRRLCG